MDAEFPDYRKVLPQIIQGRTCSFYRVFGGCCKKRASQRLGSDSVKFEIDDEQFKIVARSPDHGESIEILDANKERRQHCHSL